MSYDSIPAPGSPGDVGREEAVGAYPIKHHRACPEITRKDVSYPEALKAPTPDGLQARFDAGVIFEAEQTAAMMKRFKKAGWVTHTIEVGDDTVDRVDEMASQLRRLAYRRGHGRVAVEIRIGDTVNEDGSVERSKAGKSQAEVLTAAALEGAVDVLFGGRIVGSGRVGEPDVLVREHVDSSPRKRQTYLGQDFKDHRSFEGKAQAQRWITSSLTNPFLGDGYNRRFAYEGTPQLNDSLQLVHYWYLLNALGRAGARIGGIIGREGRVIWRDLDAKLYQYRKASAFEVYDEAYTDFRTAQRHEKARMLDPSIKPASGPEWSAACKECPWRDVCKEELREQNHITLLPDITPKRAKAHYAAGVKTIRELAELDSRTARLIDAGVDVLSALAAADGASDDTSVVTLAGRGAASLVAEGVATAGQVKELCDRTAAYSGTKVWRLAQSIDQARVTTKDRVHRARGVDFVEIPRAAVELDVDIEDDAGGMCYLIGVRETIRSRGETRTRYVPFVTWEHTPEGEASIFAEFWAYVTDWRRKVKAQKLGSLRAFYYTEHETRYFRHLADKHAGIPGVPTPEELDEFFESGCWIDMHPIVGGQLIWPVEDRTLKSLAKYVKFFWRDETPGGANSVAWYREAVGNDPERAAEMRQRLLDYNEDDVEATWRLREWVSRFGEARKPGVKLPNAADLDRAFARRTLRRIPVTAA